MKMHQSARFNQEMKVKILILHSFLKTDTNGDGYVSRQEIIDKIHVSSITNLKYHFFMFIEKKIKKVTIFIMYDMFLF